MVRPVQNDCAGARSTRGGIKRQVQDRKAKRRRESTHSVSIQHPQHSHDADLQKWKTGGSDSWRATKRGDCGSTRSPILRFFVDFKLSQEYPSPTSQARSLTSSSTLIRNSKLGTRNL